MDDAGYPKAGPPWKQGEEESDTINEAVNTQSLSLGELWDMQKDFSHCPREHSVTWMLWCWDNRAGSQKLVGKEDKQLESLSMEGDIAKRLERGAQFFFSCPGSEPSIGLTICLFLSFRYTIFWRIAFLDSNFVLKHFNTCRCYHHYICGQGLVDQWLTYS